MVLVGVLWVSFDIQNILLSIVMFYLFSIIGLSLTLHRYYSHQTFKFKNKFLEYIFTIIAIFSGRGSPLGWVYIHRLHHRHTDTEGDPHSPKDTGFRFFGFKPREVSDKKIKTFLVKDLINKQHLFVHNYYLLFILGLVLLLGFINFELLYFGYVVPLLLIQFSQNSFNYFAHKHGYKNYEIDNDSTNNLFLWPLIWGDAWHNNHHNKPQSYTTKEKWWELDPVALIIRIIKL